MTPIPPDRDGAAPRGGRWTLLGAALGAWAAALPALGLVAGPNPWFMDAPQLFLLLLGAPAAALGALLGSRFRRRSPRVARPLLALGLGLPFLLAAWPQPAPSGRVKLFVYGIDGATWEVIDGLKGELPALEGLQARGGRAVLRSMEPLFSPLLWTTLASGKAPGEHGIHGFAVQSTDCKVPRFWDIAHSQGLDVGTWKWLVTWPPSRIGAFQIPAWLAPEPDTWPADYSFVKEIELSRRMMRKEVASRRPLLVLAMDGLTHGLRMSTLAEAAEVALLQRLHPDRNRDFFRGQLLRVQMDRDVAIAALHAHPADIFTFTDYATDAIPHRFWRFHEPARFPDTDPALVERWGEAVHDSYRQADAVLADLIAAVGPQARVVVLSDHGHQALEGEALGHLLAPRTERLAARLREAVGPVDVSRLGHKLVVALNGSDPAAQRAGAIALIEALRVERTGEAIFRVEEGPAAAGTLGLAVRNEGLSPASIETDRVAGEPLRAYLTEGEAFSGDHHDRGIWLSAGPGLAQGALPELHILDVTPILLAMVGLPQGADMSGAPPAALWEGPPPELGPAPASYDPVLGERDFAVLPEAVDAVNEEQLRALGYWQ